MLAPQLDEAFGEFEERLPLVVVLPVEPADLVVLAIGIVVALLRAANSSPAVIIGTPWESRSVASRLRVLAARVQNLRVIGRPFDAAIPGVIVVVAVAVVFAVRLVVLLVVAHQVVQGEAIVRGDEIDAGVWAAAAIW